MYLEKLECIFTVNSLINVTVGGSINKGLTAVSFFLFLGKVPTKKLREPNKRKDWK